MQSIKLRDVKAAEARYATALGQYGPNNLATVRAEIAWRDAKDRYAAQKSK